MAWSTNEPVRQCVPIAHLSKPVAVTRWPRQPLASWHHVWDLDPITRAAITAAVRTQQLDSRGSAWLKALRHGSFATAGTECMPSTLWAGTAPESSRSRMWTQASASMALREDWSVSSCPLEAPASAHWRTPHRVEIRLASSFEGFCDLQALMVSAGWAWPIPP